MKLSDYVGYDAMGLAALVKKKDVSPADLLDAALAARDKVNPAINAVVIDDSAYGRKRAGGNLDGPFAGVPFLLKNLNIALKGTAVDGGINALKGQISTSSSTLAERYEDAGLVIFGKTNSPEVGVTVTTEPVSHGPSRNPWNLDHTPGGSSGGAAAAVAAGIVPAAHASDGGGSIRGPAAACGLVGLKPSRGLVPNGPDRYEGWSGCSLSHVVSRTVRDSAALLDATAGPALGDSYVCPPGAGTFLTQLKEAPGKLRIAVNTTPHNEATLHPDVSAALSAAAKLLEGLGHDVAEAAPDLDNEVVNKAFGTIVTSHIAASLDNIEKRLGRDLGEGDIEYVTRRIKANAGRISGVDLVHTRDTMHRASRVMGSFFQSWDILMEPVYAAPPAKLGTINMNSSDTRTYAQELLPYTGFTPRYNMTGQPALSLPLAMSGDGLPIGIMFSASMGADGLLLRLAAQIEEAAPWRARKPKVWAGA